MNLERSRQIRRKWSSSRPEVCLRSKSRYTSFTGKDRQIVIVAKSVKFNILHVVALGFAIFQDVSISV